MDTNVHWSMLIRGRDGRPLSAKHRKTKIVFVSDDEAEEEAKEDATRAQNAACVVAHPVQPRALVLCTAAPGAVRVLTRRHARCARVCTFAGTGRSCCSTSTR